MKSFSKFGRKVQIGRKTVYEIDLYEDADKRAKIAATARKKPAEDMELPKIKLISLERAITNDKI